ncbi:acid protease [Neolentinus lepideus HHB14362 ss-1]|uniref:Acid protease n=1 Tax=Neolentinus lepideus HHB14362 ss-1 TaxID=1314782 RepID=A0A165UPU0_9AGAM|nr:acid protease [Neolentinus lepideus HHB14362 ss-1]
MTPFLFVVLLSVLCLSARCEDGLKLPIRRVPRARTHLGVLGNMLSSDVSVHDSMEYAYIAEINIGGQEFPVLVDTGSSDLWVISTNCTDTDCLGLSMYRPTSTLSITDIPFKLNYLMGSVSGTVGYETVTLGNYQICSQVFAIADDATDLSLSVRGYSGIMGLSLSAAASISTTSGIPLLENLFSAFRNDSNKFFAYKLGRDDDPSVADVSSFTIGQLDHDVLNTLTPNASFNEIPVVSRSDGTYDFWKLPLLSITIDNQPLQLSLSRVAGSSSPLAVLDTGTTLVLGPSRDVEDFWGSFGEGSTRKNVWGQWEVRCERAVRVGFVFGKEWKEGKEYVVDPSDVSWYGGRTSDGWCLGGVQANDGVNSADWILGDVFLRNVYVKHQVPTSSQRASIGLLQITDADSAMNRFRESRGQDYAPPVQIRSKIQRHRWVKLTPAVLFTTTWAVGFIGGSLGTPVVRTIKRRFGPTQQ